MESSKVSGNNVKIAFIHPITTRQNIALYTN